MARNALLAVAILLAGLVGLFLVPSGASADGGLLDDVGDGVAELTDTLDQPVEADAEEPVDSTSGAAESGVQTLTEVSEPVSESISGATEPVARSVSEATEPLTESISQASEPVVESVNEASQPLSESISGATEPVVQTVSEAAQTLTESISKTSEPVVESVNPVLEPVVEAAEPLVQTGVDIVAPVIDPLVESVEPVLQPIVELTEPVVETILELTEPVLDPILELTEPVLAPIVEPIEPVLDPILDLTEPVLDPPLDNEDPGAGLSPVVPVPNPGLFDLIDPIVEDRQPLFQNEPIIEEPWDSAGVPFSLSLLETAAPTIPTDLGGNLDPVHSAPPILAAYKTGSSWVVRLGDAIRALDSSDERPLIHALTPTVSGAAADSNPLVWLGDDHSSDRIPGEIQSGDGRESARPPVSSSALLFFDERASSSAGGANRIDWPDSGLVVFSAALLAIGVLLLLTTTGASPRTWQFRPVTPPA